MPYSCICNSNGIFAISLSMAKQYTVCMLANVTIGIREFREKTAPIIKIPSEMDIKSIETNKRKQSSRGIYSLGTAGVQKLKDVFLILCLFLLF
jgi:hypothetical protein